MFEAAWAMYFVTVILTSGYLVLTKRRFDFFTVAYIGAIFYFSPLFFGWVFQSGPGLSDTIQPTVYLIATIYLIALAAAAIISKKSERPAPTSAEPRRRLSQWYLVLSLFGLISSIVSTRGAIVNVDKLVVLGHVGYYYVLFETAATLACISAVIERRPWELIAAVLLLFIDLFVGFRVFVTFSALCVTLILLTRDGELYLYKKLPTYGSAAVVLLVAMLLANAVRPLIFDQVESLHARFDTPVAQAGGIQGIAPGPNKQEAGSNKQEAGQNKQEPGQNKQSAKPGQAPVETPPKPISPSSVLTSSDLKSLPFKLMQQSGEPFMVQGTLVAIVQTGLSCSPSNIFKSLFLLVPPGMARFAPTNSFPPTFFDEYQPILYPNITHGTGGNIWAEMLCRFGYLGLVIFGAFLILVLIGLNRLFLKSSSTFAAPIALGGTIIAFYIHRNDLHFTLQMLKWVAIVFFAAYLLSLTAEEAKRRIRTIVSARSSM